MRVILLIWMASMLIAIAYVWYILLVVRKCSGSQPVPMRYIQNPYLYGLVSGSLSIAFVLYLIFSFQYLKLLRDRKCECATKDSGDDIMRIHSILMTVLYGLIIAVMLIVAGMTLYMLRNRM